MPRSKAVNETQVEAALRRRRGNVAAAARDLSVNRLTIYARVNESERLKNVLQDERRELRQLLGD